MKPQVAHFLVPALLMACPWNITLAKFFCYLSHEFSSKKKRDYSQSVSRNIERRSESSEETGHVDIRDLKIHNGTANKTVT